MKRIITALATAALTLLVVLPPVQAATHSTTTSSTLFVSSLNCQFQEQPDCVNVVTSITQDATGAGQFCVGIADFHEPHPPVANGCADLASARLLIDDTQVVVPVTAIQAVYSNDCYQVPPEECTPRSVVLNASATFAVTGSIDSYRDTTTERVGQCTITRQVRGENLGIVGSLTVDGFVYDLSGTDPSLHHFEAWLARENVTTSVNCRRTWAGADKDLVLDQATTE